MRRSLSALLLVLLAGACASMRSDSGKGAAEVALTSPEIQIEQLSSVGAAARHITGGLPIHYRIRVANRAGVPIKLTRATVQTIGEGAYSVSPTSSPFDASIEPEQFKEVDMWVASYIANPTLVGANGPVTLRATLFFDSPSGQFQEIVMEQLGTISGQGNNQ